MDTVLAIVVNTALLIFFVLPYFFAIRVKRRTPRLIQTVAAWLAGSLYIYTGYLWARHTLSSNDAFHVMENTVFLWLFLFITSLPAMVIAFVKKNNTEAS
jgi:quinol-cytochrome oxidoreductase complex cytochrome b subunit